MRKAQQAREALRAIPIDDLIERVGKAGELYTSGTLPMGDGTQTADEFVRAQSASTGLPEHMCRANMQKNAFVLREMRNILTSLTRGLSFDVLSTGRGEERGVPISYQAQSPVLGLVLPSNSPGVHTLWLPIIPMQVGLVLKPGPRSRGRRSAWPRPSSPPASRASRSRSTRAKRTWAPPCWTRARAA